MREQRFLRSPQSAAAPPPAPNSNRTRIEINWGEAMAKTIEIRHHYIEAATQARSIYLKPGCLQVRDLPCGIAARLRRTRQRLFHRASSLRWTPKPKRFSPQGLEGSPREIFQRL